MSISSLIFWIALFGTAAFPPVALTACIVILCAQILLITIRLAAKFLPRLETDVIGRGKDPVFSVHVATHNEPADLVITTLEALARQDFPTERWEVIVIDNNTLDVSLWHPVARRCAEMGPGFRFIHRDDVQGAKAGALNIALECTRRDATHIVTIDADYVVRSNFLTMASRALKRTGADYVQFPQAYRREGATARGVHLELEEYFRSDAKMADEAEAVLLTGTLCVISKTALTAAGGWSGRTTTEDAELGVRLCLAGYTGRYIPRVVGTGLLPLALGDLSRQRYRWASGNCRTLLHHLPCLIAHRGQLRTRQTFAVISQLGAWLNFSLVPAGCLLSALLFNVANSSLRTVAALSILVGLIDITARLMVRRIAERHSFLAVIWAIACRISLAPAAARATVAALLPGEHRFRVTRKAISRDVGWSDTPIDQLILFAFALVALLWSSGTINPLLLLALLALALPLPAGLWVASELSSYRRWLHLAERRTRHE